MSDRCKVLFVVDPRTVVAMLLMLSGYLDVSGLAGAATLSGPPPDASGGPQAVCDNLARKTEEDLALVTRDIGTWPAESRRTTYDAAAKVYVLVDDAPRRRALLCLLVGGLADSDAGIRQAAEFHLARYCDAADLVPGDGCADGACKYLGELPLNNDRMLLAGMFNCRSLIESLSRLAVDPAALTPLQALARMGDETAMGELLARIDKLVGADMSRAVSLFDRISYTRHPLAVRYLEAFLARDEELPPHDGRPSELVATHAAAQLGKMMEGFPQPADGHRYGAGDISTCREWLRKHRENLILRGGFPWRNEGFAFPPPPVSSEHPASATEGVKTD
jgi:hypothetical protein